MASRLSKGITQQSSLLKGLLKKYNALPSVSLSDALTWAEVTDLSSIRWLWGALESDLCVPKKIKLDAIKFHHNILRCDEEIELLGAEMRATVSFYMNDWQELMAAVTERLNSLSCTQLNNGALASLQLARIKCEGTLCKLASSFSRFVELERPLPTEHFLVVTNNFSMEDNCKMMIC